MSRETHTAKQIAAKKIDLEVFRVARLLEVFAAKYRDQGVDYMAWTIESMRGRVRKYMHQSDREDTS